MDAHGYGRRAQNTASGKGRRSMGTAAGTDPTRSTHIVHAWVAQCRAGDTHREQQQQYDTEHGRAEEARMGPSGARLTNGALPPGSGGGS